VCVCVCVRVCVLNERSGTSYEQAKACLDGLREIFDRALGKILLYKFERVQYSTINKSQSNVKPSAFYGAEHLLRLFGSHFAFCFAHTLQCNCPSC
jgi:mortality factor 4-like protein 1